MALPVFYSRLSFGNKRLSFWIDLIGVGGACSRLRLGNFTNTFERIYALRPFFSEDDLADWPCQRLDTERHLNGALQPNLKLSGYVIQIPLVSRPFSLWGERRGR